MNIVGEGPYLPELRRQAAETGVSVKFWGWLENRSPQLRELYESSTIFVFPSEAENFPIVLLKAMAAGLAIITTAGRLRRSDGRRRPVGAPQGPRGDHARTQAAHTGAGSRGALGTAARRRIEDNFTWSAVAGRYLDGICASHPSAP